jgi:hypothetical protein
MPRDYNSSLMEVTINQGQMFIRGHRYLPLDLLKSTPYDGRLDDLVVIVKFNQKANYEIDDSMVELLETKLARDARVNGKAVFWFQEPDKENGKPIWQWWIKDKSYVQPYK